MAYNTMLLNGFGFCPTGAYNKRSEVKPKFPRSLAG